MIKTIGACHTLRLGDWTARVDTHGAHVLTLSHGLDEVLHYDEADIGHSGIPICLPFFGPLSAPFLHKGTLYSMKQHGFFRDQVFSRVDGNEYSIVLELQSDEQSLTIFPYEFRASVTVALCEDGLDLTLAVTNRSREALPLAPGVHPYFAVGNPCELKIATPATHANNNHAGYAEEELCASGFLRKTDNTENSLPLYDIVGAPDFNLIGHDVRRTVLYDGPRKIYLDADPLVFNRLTIWKKTANAKSLCVEPSSALNRLVHDPIWVREGDRFETTVGIHFP